VLDHARQFLGLVLPPPDQGHAYYNIHWSSIGTDGKKYWDGRACDTVDEAIRTIGWVNSLGNDQYVCMSTQARFEDKTSKKGNKYRKALRAQEDVRLIRSLYDIDVKTELKKEGYDTPQDALAALQMFVQKMGLPIPSAVVGSGSGGFHAHWVLETAITRAEWQPLANSLSFALQSHGIICDTQCTVDSARILRIPETFNYKTGSPRPVELMSLGSTVTFEVMRDALAPYQQAPVMPSAPEAGLGQQTAGAKVAANDDLGAGVVRTKLEVPIGEVAKHCGFVSRSLGTGGKDNANPLWFMTASIANFVEEGRDALHLMSNQHPGYVAGDTNQLFDRVAAKQKEKDLGWPACAKIAGYGAKECQTCPLLKHGKSPLNFVLKTGVASAPDLTLPDRFVRSADGIIMARGVGDDGAPIVVPISHYPIYSGWLSNDPWTLHFTTRTESGRKASIDIPCEVITAAKDGFAKFLGSRGFFCTDVQYKALKEFFVAWLQKLQNAKESVISAAPFGWSVVDGKVEGFAFGGRVWMKDGDRPAANPNPVLTYQYTPKGDPAVWEEAAKIIYTQKRPALDAILAIGFAGPLVRFTGHGGLILNAYSPESGIGKTTAMKVSQAVWGHPVLAMQALNDTANSVLGKMGQIRSLPMYWDEIKSEAQIRQFCSIVFTMTGGREKTRMTQDAQLRMSGQWQTIMVSASNESLVDGMAREAGSTTAGLHRMFEYTVPTGKSLATDVGVVQRLIGKLEDNYGHAGMKYAKFLGINHARIEREIAAVHDELLHEVIVKQEERMWVSTVAVILKGAEYANELGLTQIDVDDLKVFLLEVFTKNRAEVGASASDLTTDQSAITVLGEFLNSTRARHTLTTNRIWVSPGKPTKGAIQVLSDLAKIYDLRVHIGREDRIIRIASTYLTEWMSERGYSRVTWVKKMEEEFGLRKTVGILGGGTELVGATEMLLELDMNHVKLSSFFE
jgi:hypothetical protein